jgi:signal transduction histidine kinase
MGIPADKLDEIFEKFRRLEDPMRMETGGAGVGLYIVRQLTQAMGGDVLVESAPGKGSTFTVWLPSATSVPDADSGHGALAG